jgi:cytochrome c oxidase assembly protein subunit 15
MIVSIYFLFRKNLNFETKRWLQLFILLAIGQGALGYIQYFLGVPEGLVALHLLGSVLVWIAAWRVRLSVVRKPA